MIKINGTEYKIEYLSDIDMKMLPGCDENTLGSIHYHSATISIKESLQPNKKRKTLIHEIVHAIRHEYGFNWEKNEEHICDFIAAFNDIIGELADKEMKRYEQTR